MPRKQIVLEGPDGSGKSTLTKLISANLTKRGIKNIITRHPGATELGQELRKLLFAKKHHPNTEALLFAADNSAYINEVLRPKLKEEYVVISDRNNFISSLAYQIASGCSIDELDRVHDAVLSPPKIDLLLIINVDWETSIARREVATDAFENRGSGYFNKVAGAYRKMSKWPKLHKFVRTGTSINYPMPNVRDIDGTQDIDRVYREVIDLINEELNASLQVHSD